jgi:membrane protein required for colicin V production
VVLAVSIFGGWRRGFILEVATILGAVAGLGVARLEYQHVRIFLETIAPKSPWLTAISYLAVFFLVWGAIVLVARRLRTLARFLMLGWMDRLGGAAIGLAQGLLFVELLLYIGKRLPNYALRHGINHSAFGPTFVRVFPYISHWFPHVAG